jgi:hypothetical protein
MCDHHNHDLDDQIDDIFGGPLSPEDREAGEQLAQAQPMKMHEERCPKHCRNGRFISYSGRDLGQCFACKGKGVVYYRQSLEQRTKAREQKARREDGKRQAWIDEHTEEVAWMRESAGRFDFARSMQEAVTKYGHLTDNQLAAVRKCMVRDAERKAIWAAERAAAEAAAPTIDISAIERSFAAALASGLKWPKLRLVEFTFQPASANSKNAGAIYVTTTGDIYLGKIVGSKFIKVRACSDEQQARILEVAADPEKAAVAYGVMTGSCSCCGRELTNPESVARGIGPICAAKWGW